MLEALRTLAVNWGSFYSNHAVMRTAVTFAHSGGLVAGGGAAVTADRGILSAFGRSDVERDSMLGAVHRTNVAVLVGLAIVAVSGVLLFAADLDTYLTSKLFWTKMVLVALLVMNGAALTAAGRRGDWETLRWTAIASLALWFLTTLSGTGLLNIG